jgi:hypothetical protein
LDSFGNCPRRSQVRLTENRCLVVRFTNDVVVRADLWYKEADFEK